MNSVITLVKDVIIGSNEDVPPDKIMTKPSKKIKAHNLAPL